MATVTVEIPDEDMKLIERFLATTRPRWSEAEGGMVENMNNTHGPLDTPKLIAMLLEDVAIMMRRPGSWEGANMWHVMSSHGYDPGT